MNSEMIILLFSYNECRAIYRTGYSMRKAIDNGELFKLSSGLYSDLKNVPDTAVIRKKYPKAVFTLNSAFFYHGLTDTVPSYYYLLTDKDAAKISCADVKQYFDNNNSIGLGLETLSYNGDNIPIFSKERLLIELIRNKSKLPFDYYKEILRNYRKIINNLDLQLVEDYAEKLPKTKMVMNIIQLEVL